MRQQRLEYFANLSDAELVKEIGDMSAEGEQIIKYMVINMYRATESEISKQLLEKFWETFNGDRNYFEGVMYGLLAGAVYDGKNKTIISDAARMAANCRHAKVQTLYSQAIESVKLDLDANCHPEWTHADYTNHLLNQLSFQNLSDKTLRGRILEIFKNRGLCNRIAKGSAQHVKRKK